jgi:hypothetical protein
MQPDVLYTTNLYGKSWGVFKSTNGGVDWDPLFPTTGDVPTYAARGAFALLISMDPTDHRHLVVAFHDGCTGPYAPDCVAETSDSGATWRLVSVPNPTHGVDGNGVVVLDTDRWLYGLDSYGEWVTLDRGAHWTQVFNDGSHRHYQSSLGIHFVPTHHHGLLRSTDLLHWTAIPKTEGIGSPIGDGRTMYGSLDCSSSNGHCYTTSPDGDGENWTSIASEVTLNSTGNGAWDPDHHILYSSNSISGLWRVVTY